MDESRRKHHDDARNQVGEFLGTHSFTILLFMERRKDSAVGVIPVYKKDDGDFLFCIVQHADGHWGFPKGHKDKDELDEETAKRELHEETGIEDVEIVPDKKFTEQYFFEANGARYDKTVSYFLGLVPNRSATTPEAFKSEISDMRWLPYEDMLRTLTFPDGKKEMLSEAWEYLQKSLE